MPIHFVDFEGSRDCGIIEFGVATLLHGEITETRTRLCKASAEVRAKESRLHGIQYSDTQNEKPFSEEWDNFTHLRKTGPLAAHHAATENNLIKMAWPYPTYSPDFLNPDQEIAEWGPWIDTCAIAFKLFPQLQSHKLQDLIDFFGLQSSLHKFTRVNCPPRRCHYHCALFDALASAVLLIYIGSLTGFEHVTISWLLNQSRSRSTHAEQKELF